MRAYLDFSLHLVPVGERQYRVDADSLSGEESGLFTLPFDDKDLQIFLLKIERPRREARRGPRTKPLQEMREFGGELFNTLFHDKIYNLLMATQRRASESEMGVRIRLRLNDAPELGHVPWEFLWDGQRFFALSDDWSIVRYPDLPRAARLVPVQFPLRILLTRNTPADRQPLDAGGEVDDLHGAFTTLEKAGLVEIDESPVANLIALEHLLRRANVQGRPYHIWHFIGHGEYDLTSNTSQLILEDLDGNSQSVDGFKLGTLLQNYARHLGLVVLNACEGALSGKDDPFGGVAASLIGCGIPAVIAMQLEISDRAARIFAGEFYTALVDGLPLDTAVSNARRAVYYDEQEVDWATPVLFLRSHEARIFDIPPAAEVEARSASGEAEKAPGEMLAQPVRGAPEEKPEKARREEDDTGVYQARRAELVKEMLSYARRSLERDHLELAKSILDQLEHVDPQNRQIGLLRLELEAASVRQTLRRRTQDQLQILQQAVQSEDWQTAIQAGRQLLAEQPEHAQGQALLAQAERGQRLAELYAEAELEYGAENWEKVIAITGEIAALDAQYPDPKGLQSGARAALERQEKARKAALEEKARNERQQKELAEREEKERQEQAQRRKQAEELRGTVLYQMSQGDWLQARAILMQIEALYPEMIELESLKVEVEAGLAKVEQEKQQQERKKTGLYQKLSKAVRDGDWEAAIQHGEGLLKEDAQYRDAKQLVQQAREEKDRILRAAQEEQQRLLVQRQTSRYSQLKQAQDAGDWERVIVLGERILNESPDYRDTAARVKAARSALSKARLAADKEQAADRTGAFERQKETGGKKFSSASQTTSSKSSGKLVSITNPQADLTRLYQRAEKHASWQRQAGAIWAYSRVQAGDPSFREVQKKMETARKHHIDSLEKAARGAFGGGEAADGLAKYGMEAAPQLIELYVQKPTTLTTSISLSTNSKIEKHLVKLGAPLASLLISAIRVRLTMDWVDSLLLPKTSEALKIAQLLGKVADQSHTQAISDLLKAVREHIQKGSEQFGSARGSANLSRSLLGNRSSTKKPNFLDSSRRTGGMSTSFSRNNQFSSTRVTWADVATALAQSIEESKKRKARQVETAPVYYPPIALACLLDEAHKEVTSEGSFGGFKDYLRKRWWDVNTLQEKPLHRDRLKGKYVMIIGGPQSPLLLGRGAEKWEPEEIDLVEKFVKEGGGLLVMGNSLGSVELLNPLCERFGIRFLPEAIFGGEPGKKAAHPVMEAVGNIKLIVLGGKGGHPIQSGPAQALAISDPNGDVLMAASEVGLGRVVALASVDAISGACLEANQKLLDNIFTWLLAECAPRWE